MPVLQLSHRLESPEVGDSGSDSNYVRSKTRRAAMDIVNSGEAGTKDMEQGTPYRALDEKLRQTLEGLIQLIGNLATELNENDVQAVGPSEKELYEFIQNNPKPVFLLFRRLYDLAEQEGGNLPRGYMETLQELTRYWDALGLAIHPKASESDRRYIDNQATGVLMLFRQFQTIHIPNLEKAIQIDRA